MNILKVFSCMMLLVALSACTHHQEKKAPCSKVASLSAHPCNPLPVNVALVASSDVSAG